MYWRTMGIAALAAIFSVNLARGDSKPSPAQICLDEMYAILQLHLNNDQQIALCEKALQTTADKDQKYKLAITWGAIANRAYGTESHTARFYPDDRMARARGPGGEARLEKAIAAFSTAIEIDPQQLTGYLWRAHMLHAKHDFDGAIKDFDEVIRLAPDEAGYLQQRGDLWRGKGDLEHAIADYDKEIEMASFFLDAYRARGLAYYLRGDYQAAVKDFEHANRRVDPDISLLLYLAHARAGEDGTEELKANAARMPQQDWPRQMIEFFLGQRSREKLFEGKGVQEFLSSIPPTQDPMVADRRAYCQSKFYLAQWYDVQNSRAQAIALLQQATTTACPTSVYFNNGHNYDSSDYDASVIELKRLTQ